jgi:hypothetical protein
VHTCVRARAQAALSNVLLFKNLDPGIQRKVVSDMWERAVPAGEILIQEGDFGAAASELYVVKEGKFEVRPEARSTGRLGRAFLDVACGPPARRRVRRRRRRAEAVELGRAAGGAVTREAAVLQPAGPIAVVAKG